MRRITLFLAGLLTWVLRRRHVATDMNFLYGKPLHRRARDERGNDRRQQQPISSMQNHWMSSATGYPPAIASGLFPGLSISLGSFA
jgi:hypothetical protein